MNTQELTNYRVRRALMLSGFDAQLAAMRVILAACPWYVEWLDTNRDQIRRYTLSKEGELQ
jgi:capsule polysaccharide export protein KpsC/LpsZ